MAGGSVTSGILSSAAASFQLLPHLLGFPIGLIASEEVLPLPEALVDPQQAPRSAKLSYKGAMLDGLQASRTLYNAQPPGNSPGRQDMEPDQAPPGEALLRVQQLIDIMFWKTQLNVYEKLLGLQSPVNSLSPKLFIW